MADNRMILIVSGDEDDTLIAAWLENPCPEHGTDLFRWWEVKADGLDHEHPMGWLQQVCYLASEVLPTAGHTVTHEALTGVINRVFAD